MALPPPTELDQDFRFLRQFNTVPFSKKTRCKDKLRESDQRWFPGDYLSSVFARSLCTHRAMPFKEVLESFEFYACVRKHVRRRSMADLCCGHGLVGILFAMFEKRVEQVTLIDKVRPASFDTVLQSALEVAPWVREKIHFIAEPLYRSANHIEPLTAILGIHACGRRSDDCIQRAISAGGPLALLPCCRDHREHPSPQCLKQLLGADLAIDVDRTYTLANAGYHVRWDRIPSAITPMNRVIVGIPPKPSATEKNSQRS